MSKINYNQLCKIKMYRRKQNKPKINHTKYYYTFSFIEVEIKNIH